MFIPPIGRPSYVTDLSTSLIRLSDKGDYVTLDDFFQGIFITGAIGGGKTSGSGHYLSSTALSSGFGLLVCCIKQGEAAAWKRKATRAGRSKDVIVIDGTKHSSKINFLQYLMAMSPDAGALVLNTVNALTTVINSMNGNFGQATGDSAQFFQKAMREAHSTARQCVRAAYSQVDLFSLFTLIQARPMDQRQATSMEWRNSSFMAHTLRLAQPKMHEMDFRSAEHYLTQVLANPDQRVVGNIIATISADLSPLTSGKLREIFCEGTTVVPEAIFEGGILIIDLPYETYGDAGRLAQLLMKYLVQKAAIARPRHPHMRPAMIYADEAQFLISSYDNEFQSLAREARCSTVYLTQNISALMSVIGGSRPEDTVNGLLGNFNLKIAHANTDHKTNLWYADMIDKGIRLRANGGATRGGGTSETIGDTNSHSKDGGSQGWSYSKGGNLSWGQSAGWSEVYDYLLPPGEFTRLRKGGALNGCLVDGLVIRNGQPFKHTGQIFLPVVFNQKA